MTATRAAASNCLQHLGARMLAVSILEPVSAGGRAGSSHTTRGRPFWRHTGRPRSVANGAVPPFAAVEAASPTGTSESRNPHFAYNKTIPYRFVMVKNASMRYARETSVLTELSAGRAPPNGSLGDGLNAARWPKRTGQKQPDRQAHALFGGLHLQRRSERRHAVRVTDDHVEKDLSRGAGILDVHGALCDQFINEARGRGNGLQPAFFLAKFGNVGKVDGLRRHH